MAREEWKSRSFIEEKNKNVSQVRSTERTARKPGEEIEAVVVKDEWPISGTATAASRWKGKEISADEHVLDPSQQAMVKTNTSMINRIRRAKLSRQEPV